MIVAFKAKDYLLCFNVQLQGKTYVRIVQVIKLIYKPDGMIMPILACK